MNMIEIITKKRDGNALSKEEIDYLVEGYTNGEIPDYQVSALLMAIYFNDINEEETIALTNAMKVSGEVIDLSAIHGTKVDKHSTGGVGDKTTLIVAPIAAACGVPVAKMSGRGLGFTGGTVDKLESIPGFKTTMSRQDFIEQVNRIGIALIGQSEEIAKADKLLYALRDVTGTVENIGLITSSIMSKKLAGGSDAIVLDVKCGNGAFMQDEASAKQLAELMEKIGNASGKQTVALITDMNVPLGNAVGNSLEVIEAIETLKGKGPKDITELSIELAGHMIYAGKAAKTLEDGFRKAEESLSSGIALNKLGELIRAQGGNPKVIDDYSLFPQAKYSEDVIYTGEEQSIMSGTDASGIGLASQISGAGRQKKTDSIDLGAGIYMHRKPGDEIATGDRIATIYSSDEEKLQNAVARFNESTYYA